MTQSRLKLATSLSGNHIPSDDELDDENFLPTASSSQIGTDDTGRRISETASITNFTISKTSNEFHSSSRQSSPRSSGQSLAISMPPMSTSRSAPMQPNAVEAKEKTGVRKFMRKIFRSSANPSKSSNNLRSSSLGPSASGTLNVDLVHGTAYPPMSPLPITQGPIRLLVLRHGERLDRYYSSQWLRQAFDKDGNFCRFSPILP